MRSLGQRIFAKSEKVGVQGRGLQVFILEVGENNYNRFWKEVQPLGKMLQHFFKLFFRC